MSAEAEKAPSPTKLTRGQYHCVLWYISCLAMMFTGSAAADATFGSDHHPRPDTTVEASSSVCPTPKPETIQRVRRAFEDPQSVVPPQRLAGLALHHFPYDPEDMRYEYSNEKRIAGANHLHIYDDVDAWEYTERIISAETIAQKAAVLNEYTQLFGFQVEIPTQKQKINDVDRLIPIPARQLEKDFDDLADAFMVSLSDLPVELVEAAKLKKVVWAQRMYRLANPHSEDIKKNDTSGMAGDNTIWLTTDVFRRGPNKVWAHELTHLLDSAYCNNLPDAGFTKYNPPGFFYYNQAIRDKRPWAATNFQEASVSLYGLTNEHEDKAEIGSRLLSVYGFDYYLYRRGSNAVRQKMQYTAAQNEELAPGSMMVMAGRVVLDWGEGHKSYFTE